MPQGLLRELIIVGGFASAPVGADEVEGVALVKVDDPAQGSLPEIISGHGTNLGSPVPGEKAFHGRVRGVGAAIDPPTKLVPVTIDVPVKSGRLVKS
jgi:hypothetical protein